MCTGGTLTHNYLYPNSKATMISIKLHHGDLEIFGLIEMKEFVEELGYDKQKEDVRLFEKWVDHDIEFDGEVGKGKSVDNILLSEEMQNMIKGEHSEGGEDSDEFQSVHGSDDDVSPKFPNLKEQFSKIRDYCLELMRSNPGSTVVLKLIDDEGPQGGQLLTTVGVDPNNAMYPIAYAILENETKDSWVWFLSLLQSDLELDEEYAWTCTSDKQKGLISAFESLFSNAENRFCVRNEDPQDYVYDVYKMSTYLKCYEHAIQGINGAELWTKWHNARRYNKSSGQAEEMPTGTSQPPSTQESNHSQPISLKPFNTQFVLRSLQQHFQVGKNHL
ncbi:UNVERIFIED_CONTAM: hypothetical protein Slati_3865900, partial [Sesamum latifolium]